ncbi:hypothetical protein D3C81_1517160 [compost metagenome]
MHRLIVNAVPITTDSIGCLNQASTINPSPSPRKTPLIKATVSSFFSSVITLDEPICPRARPRTISASTWVPALPPRPATIGISAASATNCAIVASNSLTTLEAMKAVPRLTDSQIRRRRKARRAGLNMSSSSSRPAALIAWCSACSRMMSTTSSMVIRPSRMLLSSTTGAEIQSWSENCRATSCELSPTSMAGCSSSISRFTGVVSSWVTSEASDTRPRYWWRRLTTNR